MSRSYHVCKWYWKSRTYVAQGIFHSFNFDQSKFLMMLFSVTIGHVNEYPTLHYFGIPRQTQSIMTYKKESDWVFLKIQVENGMVGMLLTCPIWCRLPACCSQTLPSSVTVILSWVSTERGGSWGWGTIQSAAIDVYVNSSLLSRNGYWFNVMWASYLW